MLRTRLQTCFSIHIVPNCVACFFLSDLAFVRDWLMMVQSCSINGKLWVSIGTHFHQVPLDFWPPEVSQTGKWFWQTLGSQIRNGLRWEWLQIMCQAYPTWVFQYISIAKNFMVVRNWSPTKRMKCKCVCVEFWLLHTWAFTYPNSNQVPIHVSRRIWVDKKRAWADLGTLGWTVLNCTSHIPQIPTV